MYYRLNNDFILRGWQQITGVIVKRPENNFQTLDKQEFELLLLCDGVTDFTNLPFTKKDIECLNKFIEKGIVVKCENPEPLLEDQIYQYYENRFVRSCFWSITGRCNYKCRHCYMDAPDGALGELSHEEALNLIDQMAACGILQVELTGGEPFVRKDFWELIDKMLAYHIVIKQIYTNGWLLTEEVLDKFEQRGIKPVISISFDGIGWHDWMRGINGAERAALNAMRLCKKRGFPMNVQMCLHKGNFGVFRETVNKLAKIGVPALKCSSVSDTELWEKNAEGNACNMKEYADAMLEYIPHFYEDGMPMELLISGIIQLYKASTEYGIIAEAHDGTEGCMDCYLCNSVRSSCYITPEGRLLPCMPMTSCEEQLEFDRFQDIGLKEGLSGSFYMQFVDKRVRDLLAVNEKCNACPYKLKCTGGCRASALMKTGDLMGHDPDLCLLWENGYVEKIHQVTDAAIAKFCSDFPK